MNQPSQEVVRIGIGGARIVRVLPNRIEYLDTAGQEQVVELEECAKSWMRFREERRQEFVPVPGVSEEQISKWNSRCVGQRGALDRPPWVEFMNERKTRFEFASYEALYEELLTPLQRANWRTFDTC